MAEMAKLCNTTMKYPYALNALRYLTDYIGRISEAAGIREYVTGEMCTLSADVYVKKTMLPMGARRRDGHSSLLTGNDKSPMLCVAYDHLCSQHHKVCRPSRSVPSHPKRAIFEDGMQSLRIASFLLFCTALSSR
jgi:hypothetical protein